MAGIGQTGEGIQFSEVMMMVDERGRDIGEPVVEIRYIPATPELVAKTRANFTRVMEGIYSEKCGHPMKVNVLWGEKPSWYGIDRVGPPKRTPEEIQRRKEIEERLARGDDFADLLKIERTD